MAKHTGRNPPKDNESKVAEFGNYSDDPEGMVSKTGNEPSKQAQPNNRPDESNQAGLRCETDESERTPSKTETHYRTD